MTSTLGNSWQTFNTCVESEEGYAKLSEKVLESHFEEERIEKLTELTTLIEIVIMDQKASFDKKFLALSVLKDASKRPSKRFGTAIVKQKNLLQELYKLATTYTKREPSASGVPAEVEAKYVLLVVELICYWKAKFGEGESNTAEAFRRLKTKLTKTIELPQKFVFFESEERPDKLDTPTIQEKKAQGKLKLLIPEETGLTIKVKSSDGENTVDQLHTIGSTDDYNRGAVFTLGPGTKTKQYWKEVDGNSNQKDPKRTENFKKLRDELNAYRANIASKVGLLNKHTGDLNEFIWKAKGIILELNFNITKINTKCEMLKNEYSNMTEEEQKLIQDAKIEDEKHLEFDTYLQKGAQNDIKGKVMRKVEAFFDIKLNSPENKNVNSPNKKFQDTNQMSDAESVSTTLKPRSEAGDSGFRSLVNQRGRIANDDSSSYLQSSKDVFSRTASQNSAAMSYNPQASEQALRKLMKSDKSIFNDLQRIQNGIASSLQQRQKSVPWKASDQLEKIKQEYTKPKVNHSISSPLDTRTHQKPIVRIHLEGVNAQNIDDQADSQSLEFGTGFGVQTPRRFQYNSPSMIHRSSMPTIQRDSSNESKLSNQMGSTPTQKTRQTTNNRMPPDQFHFSEKNIRQDDPYGLKKTYQASSSKNVSKQLNTDNYTSENENIRTDRLSVQSESKGINYTNIRNHKAKFNKEFYAQENEVPQENQLKELQDKMSPRSVAFKNTNDVDKPLPTVQGKSKKSGPESSLSKDPKYSSVQGRTTVSPLMSGTKAKGIGGVRAVKDSTWFNELVEHLSLSSNPKALDQFCIAACKGRGCVFDNNYVNVNSKYNILEDSDQGYKALKITLLFGNKTNSTLNYFAITFVKDLNINFISLPDKTTSSIAPGKQTRVEFVVSITRLPFTHLKIKCGAKLTNSDETQDLNFDFVLPVTYNMFMSFQTQITNQEFLESWKVPTRVILKGEPRKLTSPLIKTAEDFSNVLGHLLVFPGYGDESGEPKAYALMGVFELERKNMEYLIKISWIPKAKVVVFEVACTEKSVMEGEFVLQTLEFLFSESQEK